MLARSLEKMGVSAALVTGFSSFIKNALSLHTTVHGHYVAWWQEPRATVGRECLPVVGML